MYAAALALCSGFLRAVSLGLGRANRTTAPPLATSAAGLLWHAVYLSITQAVFGYCCAQAAAAHTSWEARLVGSVLQTHAPSRTLAVRCHGFPRVALSVCTLSSSNGCAAVKTKAAWGVEWRAQLLLWHMPWPGWKPVPALPR
jgi:hypothetical protein